MAKLLTMDSHGDKPNQTPSNKQDKVLQPVDTKSDKVEHVEGEIVEETTEDKVAENTTTNIPAVVETVEPKNNKGYTERQANVARAALKIGIMARAGIANLTSCIDENAPEYEANQQLIKGIETCMKKIFKLNSAEAESSEDALNNHRKLIMSLNNAMRDGAENAIFAKDPSTMTPEEIGIHVDGVRCAFEPMRDKDTGENIIKNFANTYGVHEEEMTATQMDTMQKISFLGAIGEHEKAAEYRSSHGELIAIGEKQNELDLPENAAKMENNTDAYQKVQEDAKKEMDKQELIMKAYKPLFVQMTTAMVSAAYQKHEENIARKEAIREWNVQEVCKGTMKAMEESQRESERLNHDRLYGPHGLLRA